MSRHVAVYDAGEGSRYIGVRGYVSDLLKAQRIPATRDRIKRCAWVRRERLDDLLCLLEHEGYQVKLIEGEPR